MFVCKRLEELRKKFHYSSQDCAYLLKISRNKYEQIEAGRLPPSCAEVLRMAKIFNVTTDYLMGMDLTEDDADYCINDKEDDDFVVRLTRLMAYNNEDVNPRFHLRLEEPPLQSRHQVGHQAGEALWLQYRLSAGRNYSAAASGGVVKKHFALVLPPAN